MKSPDGPKEITNKYWLLLLNTNSIGWFILPQARRAAPDVTEAIDIPLFTNLYFYQ
jgi:hypothetical protein